MFAVPDVTQLQPGDPEAIDEYRVLSRLGAGGQGVVYLAIAPSGERVAIKRLLAAFGDEETRRQFAKEVSAARRVAPFCTAQVVDVRLDGAMPYVVSEFIDGSSLYEQVRDHGPITGVALQRLAIGTTTALTAIHSAGLVHRDLKPANVMLAADGPRVIDFGVARDLSMETTMNSRVLGTPAFMAPEQLRGERIGPAADLFAWASVMAYAATGRTIFDAPHVVAVMHRIAEREPDLTGVPADLLPILRWCLNKDPAQRPSAQQALVELLGRPRSDAAGADPAGVLAEAAELVQVGRRELWQTAVQARLRALRFWASGSLTSEMVGLAGVAVIVLLALVVWSADVFTAAPDRAGADANPDRPELTVGTDSGAVDGSGAIDETPPPASPAASSIPAKYRGSWIGSYQLAGSNDQTRTVKLDSHGGQGALVVSFTGLGCQASLYFMNSSAKYVNLAAETSSDLTGVCGAHASVTLRLTAAGELLMTWEDAASEKNRITAVLRRA